MIIFTKIYVYIKSMHLNPVMTSLINSGICMNIETVPIVMITSVIFQHYLILSSLI